MMLLKKKKALDALRNDLTSVNLPCNPNYSARSFSANYYINPQSLNNDVMFSFHVLPSYIVKLGHMADMPSKVRILHISILYASEINL